MSCYDTGLHAEAAVLRGYQTRGSQILAQRHRNAAGEIDLILREQDTIVFVEVKHRKTIHDAAHAISARQWARIAAAAEIYIASCHETQNCFMRFDAALTDRYGNVEIVENAMFFDD